MNETHKENSTPDTSHIENPEVMHEKSDVNLRGVVTFAVTLAVATALVCALMWGLYRFLEHQVAEKESQEPPATLVTSDQPKGPPGPILQGAPGSKAALKNPALEYQQFKRDEDAQLENWGWVDQSAGVVRMPIETAKEKLLEKGLPFRQQAAKTEPENNQAEKPQMTKEAGAGHQQ